MSRVDRWLFEPVPARRLEVVRAVTFGYAAVWLAVRLPYLLDVAALPARRFEPIGVLWWLDRPIDRGVVLGIWVIALSSCLVAAAGRWLAVSAPVAAVSLLVVTTYTSSFGQVFHTENLLVLHVIVLAAACASGSTRPRDASGSGAGDGLVEAWPLRLMTLALIVAYVLAGWAKLRHGGLDWLTGDTLANQVAYDNLRKVLVGDVHSPVGGWLAGVGWIWPPLSVATVVVELGAPLALLGGRWRAGWIGAAWLFHLGVLGLMAILFPYQLFGVAYLSLMPAERIPVRAQQLWRRVRAAV